MTRQRLRTAAATDIAQDDIKVTASATALASPTGQGQVRAEVKIDATKLSLEQVGTKRETIIDLMILCGDAEQKVVGRISQQMTLSLDEARYQQAMTTGIPYVATVPVNRPAAIVKVVVYEYAADLVGADTVRVR